MSYFPKLIITSSFLVIIRITICRSDSNYIESRESEDAFDNEYYDDDRTESHKNTAAVTELPTYFTEYTAKFDNNALKKYLIMWFKLRNVSFLQNSSLVGPKYEFKIKRKRFANNINDYKAVGLLNDSTLNYSERPECASCKFYEHDFYVTTNGSIISCLTGKNLPTVKCRYHEACYVEAHPRKVVRGCIDPRKANRTFACKCSMCNDKPYKETGNYQKERDWRYDNAQIQQTSLKEMSLCKACETEGLNRTRDDICMDGAKAESVICAANQICATTSIEADQYVWRGCVNNPIYNSMWYFCSTNRCNDQEIRRRRTVSETLLSVLKTGTPEEIKMFLRKNGSIGRKRDDGVIHIVVLTIALNFVEFLLR